ncbi:hypothetical protein V5799_015820 [Amblyomma americanum]|uniref:Uncharacterized protein n=1 Tax=Amblyomma americanum TaxID=6943 RepID=A0AAQ4F6S3_AMBAM
MHLLLSWHAVWLAGHFARGRFLALVGADHGHKQQYHGSLCLVPMYLALGDVLFASYSALVFPPRVRRDVKALVLSVREAFARSLNEYTMFAGVVNALAGWGSVKHVFSLLDYAQEVNDTLHRPIPGLPDFSDVFALNWRMAVQASRRSDQPPKRMLLSGTLFHARLFETSTEDGDFVLVPVALSYPMYDVQATGAVKYGGLGSHVALASARIVLGLCGGTDEDGAADCRQALAAFSQCVGITHNAGSDLVEELLALFFLLDAYSRSDDREKRRLEALPGFSSTQLFFLTWCFMRCAGTQSTQGDADPCSPVLRHVKAFSEAFECVQGTRLNTAHRCELFPQVSG